MAHPAVIQKLLLLALFYNTFAPIATAAVVIEELGG